MPGVDGTGPDGSGGWCTPLWMSGQIQRPLGVGDRGFYGRGFRGGGRGRRNMFYATGLPGWIRFGTGRQAIPQTSPPQAKEGEMQWLKQEAQALEQQLNEIKTRIEELKKEG